MKDIMKGDEIFVKYNYPIGSPAAQSWYRELYEVEVGPWPSKPEWRFQLLVLLLFFVFTCNILEINGVHT